MLDKSGTFLLSPPSEKKKPTKKDFALIILHGAQSKQW